MEKRDLTHERHRLNDLLVGMRRQRRQFAVVVDELGTVAGIVTLEDVIEEVIGEFEDETDRPRRRIRPVAPGTWAVAGSVRPDEFAGRTGIELPDGEWETVAGFVIGTLDRIPSVGDTVHAAGLRLDVTAMDHYSIVEVVVRIDAGSADPAGGASGDEGRGR